MAWPSLYRYAYLLTGHHADAEDVAQQTLLQAYRSWHRVSASRLADGLPAPDAHQHLPLAEATQGASRSSC